MTDINRDGAPETRIRGKVSAGSDAHGLQGDVDLFVFSWAGPIRWRERSTGRCAPRIEFDNSYQIAVLARSAAHACIDEECAFDFLDSVEADVTGLLLESKSAGGAFGLRHEWTPKYPKDGDKPARKGKPIVTVRWLTWDKKQQSLVESCHVPVEFR